MKYGLNQRFWGMLSLSQKAGALSVGESRAQETIRGGKASMIILSADASDNTKKKFKNMCEFYEVPIYIYGDKDSLGHAMGKEFRAMLAVNDLGFAKGIMKHLDNEQNTIA